MDEVVNKMRVFAKEEDEKANALQQQEQDEAPHSNALHVIDSGQRHRECDEDPNRVVRWQDFDQISDMTMDASDHSFGSPTRQSMIAVGSDRRPGTIDPFQPIFPSSFEPRAPSRIAEEYRGNDDNISLTDDMIWPCRMPHTTTISDTPERNISGLWNIAKFVWQNSSYQVTGFTGGGVNSQGVRNRTVPILPPIFATGTDMPHQSTAKAADGCADDEEEQGGKTPSNPDSIKVTYPENIDQQPGALAVYPARFYASVTMLSSNAADSLNEDCMDDGARRNRICNKRPFGVAILFFLVFGVIVIGAMSVGIIVGTSISKKSKAGKTQDSSSSSQSSRMMKLIRFQLDECIYPRATTIPPFDDPTTAQYKALQWLIHEDATTVQHYYERVAESGNLLESKDDDPYLDRLTARYALATLYYSTGMDDDSSIDDDGEGNFLSPSSHECDWKLPNQTSNAYGVYGIGCDAAMSISRLNLGKRLWVGAILVSGQISFSHLVPLIHHIQLIRI